ncbi:hypothetical protein PQX77_006033 [Marasmius sp. AFHP31]|nr:hypothetical protein PQX77_006033 [Marasmius sp. AFHP31]
MTSLDDGYGALYVGLVLCTLLHGVTLSQAWHFYSNQSQIFKDPLGVTWEWRFQRDSSPSLSKTFMYGGFGSWFIRASTAQFFCTCGQEALQLYSMSLVARNPDSKTFTGTMTSIVIAVNGMGAGIDVVIAIAMTLLLYLRRTRIDQSYASPNRDLFCDNRGSDRVSTFTRLLVFVSALTLPGKNWLLTFYLMLTRMYSNSLLATLNVRDSIRAVAGTTGIVSDSGIVPANRTTPATVTVGSYRLNDLKRAASSEHQVEGISIKVDKRTEVEEF